MYNRGDDITMLHQRNFFVLPKPWGIVFNNVKIQIKYFRT